MSASRCGCCRWCGERRKLIWLHLLPDAICLCAGDRATRSFFESGCLFPSIDGWPGPKCPNSTGKIHPGLVPYLGRLFRLSVSNSVVTSERGASFDMQKLLPIGFVIVFAWCSLSEAADDGLEVVVQPEAILLDHANIRRKTAGGWEFNPLGNVELFYSLRNGSHEPISLGLWTCSQSQNWESTIQWLSVGGKDLTPCNANGVEIIILAPGQMHLGSVYVSARVPAPADRSTFRLKFISYNQPNGPDGRQWLSNEISVQMY
jgi:hypothetical protein